MKIETFQTLEAVLREGSFAGAAQAMHLTPSAVSMQMKQLENYLGEALFDRSGQQVRATPQAHRLVGSMQPALEVVAAMRRRTHTVIEGRLRVGMIENLQPLLLPTVVSYLRQHHPRLTVLPQRGNSMELTEAVKAGQLDSAVVARPPVGAQTSLHWTALLQRPLVCIAPPDAVPSAPRAAAKERALTAPQLAALFGRLDWIRYDRGTTTGAMATRFVRQCLPDKRSLMELDSAAAIVAMVHAGLGFSVLQLINTGLLQQYPVQMFALPPGGPVFDLCAVQRMADIDDRLHQAWLQALRAATARLPA
jgi:DNA-binding transcriptional LysR family regulator